MNLELDPEKIEEVASRLRAMAHPMRIAIMGLLEKEGELSVTQIYSILDIEQAVASHHLIILKNKKILNSRREGKNTFYSIQPNSILKIADCISKCNT